MLKKYKKPEPPVVIDPSNPLANGLTACILLYDKGIAFDVLEGRTLPFTDGDPTRALETRWRPNGILQGVQGNSGTANRPQYKYEKRIYAGTKQSFAFGGMKIGNAAEAHHIWKGTSRDEVGFGGSKAEVYLSNAATTIRLQFEFSYTTLNTSEDFVFTRNASGNSGDDYGCRGYLNGELQTLTFNDTGLGASAAYAPLTGASILQNGNYLGSNFYSYFYCWERDLSATEAKLLANDPFQFLKPLGTAKLLPGDGNKEILGAAIRNRWEDGRRF